MREAMSRFSLKSSAVPNASSLAASTEKFPSYAFHRMARTKNQVGESETAIFLPRKSEPSAPTFCKMMSELVPPLPTGETWKPVGAVRKKLLAFSETGRTSSELP